MNIATPIMIAGDTHGNYRHWKQVLVPAAIANGVTHIVQLGDFGYWPRIGDGSSYIQYLEALLTKNHLQVIFIDGNHEDHLALTALSPRPDGFVDIAPHILWAPRGQRWQWQGVRFLALGGAFSIDRKYRKLNSGHYGWFDEELITDQQVEQAMQGGPCDVLLAHDTPRATMGFLLKAIGALQGTPYLESEFNAQQVQKVALATRPQQLWHGHWHTFLDFNEVSLDRPFEPPLATMRIVGLDCDETENSFSLLSLPNLQVTHAAALDRTPEPFSR